MTLRFKLIAIALFGLATVAGYALWEHHVEQLGAAKVEARDAKLALEATERVLEQIKRDIKTNEDAVNGLQAERDRLAAAIAAVPVPVVRMCVAAPSGGGGLSAATRPAGAVGQGSAAGGSLPGVPAGDSGGTDVGPELLVIAQWAERLAGEKRALLERERELQH